MKLQSPLFILSSCSRHRSQNLKKKTKYSPTLTLSFVIIIVLDIKKRAFSFHLFTMCFTRVSNFEFFLCACIREGVCTFTISFTSSLPHSCVHSITLVNETCVCNDEYHFLARLFVVHYVCATMRCIFYSLLRLSVHFTPSLFHFFFADLVTVFFWLSDEIHPPAPGICTFNFSF